MLSEGQAFGGERIYESEHLTETESVELTAWERLRLRLERLTSRAELNYPWPRVVTERTVPAPYLYHVAGLGFVGHPVTSAKIIRLHKQLKTAYDPSGVMIK